MVFLVYEYNVCYIRFNVLLGAWHGLSYTYRWYLHHSDMVLFVLSILFWSFLYIFYLPFIDMVFVVYDSCSLGVWYGLSYCIDILARFYIYCRYDMVLFCPFCIREYWYWGMVAWFYIYIYNTKAWWIDIIFWFVILRRGGLISFCFYI